MCGICAVVTLQFGKESCCPNNDPYIQCEASLCRLRQRGPDKFHSESVVLSSGVQLHLFGSLLHLRGSSSAVQPYKDKHGNILLWNGEIFGGLLSQEENLSDTVLLSDKLSQSTSEKDLLEVFETIQGPWSFIYYQKSKEYLWFGRDIFGRRSLLWSFTDASPEGLSFRLSSVMLESKYSWKEVPCEGIFCVDCASSLEQERLVVNRYSWQVTASGGPVKTELLTESSDTMEITSSDHCLLPPVTIPLNKQLHETGLSVNCDSGEDKLFSHLMSLTEFREAVDAFEDVLSNAVKLRVQNQPGICKNCKEMEVESCSHSSVCVLFSGGLDSMVLAALADRHIPAESSVDLINVAFSSGGAVDGQQHSFKTPDRSTAHQGLKELQYINPHRKWTLVEVNVPQAELEQERQKTIGYLIAPSCTVLDDSIGCAMWFAARGRGIINSQEFEPKSSTYQCPARVVLVGIGADELLAGYSRHRAKFSKGSWIALIDEVGLEIDRIGSRNLGRDDRIISSHGREARFPFLDESVVCFLNKTPMHLKANLHYPRGVGEKLLLRLLASKLGLRKTAALPKRAMQFGSRIARCENRKEQGNDICHRIKVFCAS